MMNQIMHEEIQKVAESDYRAGKKPNQNPYNSSLPQHIVWAHYYGQYAMGVALGQIEYNDEIRLQEKNLKRRAFLQHLGVVSKIRKNKKQKAQPEEQQHAVQL